MRNGLIKAISLKVKDAFLDGKSSVTFNGNTFSIEEGGRPHEYYLSANGVSIGLRFTAMNNNLSFSVC